jgi:hypothetical protein
MNLKTATDVLTEEDDQSEGREGHRGEGNR